MRKVFPKILVQSTQ